LLSGENGKEWEEVPGTTTEVIMNLFPEEISEEVEHRRQEKMETWHHHRGKREPFPEGD
jgi:hypothetical protein